MADSKSGGIFSSDVFSRREVDGAVVSPATYNVVIGLVLCWGFLVNWLLVRHVDPAELRAIPPMIFFIGYFASCFLGIYLFNTSKDPAVSFLGYNFVVVPFGLIVNLVVSRYSPGLVLDAVRTTAMVTMAMMFMGTVNPGFFLNMGTTLFVALASVILVELVQVFIFHMATPGWLDGVVVLIFCGYVGYDWARANAIPKTVDNAVDSAAAIYMDIINLFLRILRLMGRNRD